MIFTHIPLGTSIAVGLACFITMLIAYLRPGAMETQAWVWLGVLSLCSAMHVYHSYLYYGSKQRHHPSWFKRNKLSILSLSACWSMMLWVMPLEGHVELQAALVGSIIGLAACGAFMLTVDQVSARCWLVPMLSSAAIYCAFQFSVLGLFGFVTVLGFIGALWLETGRAHRRMSELLFLRFNNDRITAAQAAALREAEELSQAKVQFLATMSHEMRTPLHGILGLSRLIRSELESQQAHERMNLLEAAGQHLLGVINDVLDYSRLQAGRIELSPSVLNLPELAREVTSLAAVNGLDKGLDVLLESSLPANYFVAVDGGRLKQVLHNLLGNAVKFTEQGSVVLKLRESPDALGVYLEVVDTGIGIPAHELRRVFDAFHQVDGRYERKASGSGLGLSIARELCLAMGGELSCDSEVGKGSTFRCLLPLKRVPEPASTAVSTPTSAIVAARALVGAASREAKTQQAASASSSQDFVHAVLQGVFHADADFGSATTSSTAPPLPAQPAAEPADNTATVLLVEDNPVNAIVARTELEQMGLQVAHAENGQVALDWLAEHEADLVLMDCHMPEMNGFDAARHIRAIESQHGRAPVPIVAITASTQHEVQQECLQAGMDDCLAKPFLRSDLLRVVKRYVRQQRRRTARRTLKVSAALSA